MNWKDEQSEKFKEFGSLAITLFLDTFLVVFVAAFTEGGKWVIEKYIIFGKLEQSTNTKLHAAYTISQIVLITVVVIYAVVDIVKHIKSAWKEIKK